MRPPIRHFFHALCVAMLLCITTTAHAQVFVKPEYDTKKTPKELKLHKVEVNKKYTICEVSYTYEGNDRNDPNFIYVIPEMHILDVKTNEKYYIIKSENIPMYPKQYQFKTKGEVLYFRIYFPRIDPQKSVLFHILEEVDRGFKFYGIHLYPFA